MTASPETLADPNETPDPNSLFLHREWTLWIKVNTDSWVKRNFKRIFTLRTVAEMWGVLNNIPVLLAGQANIFFMVDDLVPLWEERKDIWSKGGCWSTIVKENNWLETMRDICATTFGESTFSENVKGICIVPVSQSHCIVKMWTTKKSEVNNKLLQQSLSHLGCCPPRFKSFSN